MRRLRSVFSAAVPLLVLVAVLGLVWSGCSDTKTVATAPDQDSGKQTEALVPGATTAQVVSAMEVQNRHTPDLMAIPDVVGTGIGQTIDGRLAILVLTRTRGVNSAVPAVLDGVPTQIRVVGDVEAFAYTKQYRPVPGGVSIGNANECASGTVGCTVIKSGVRYALSNNHVLARVNAAAIGERINQPGRYDGKPRCAQTGQVGTLAQFVPISFSGNNTVDAAIARYTTTDVCSMVSNLYTPSSTVVSPTVGLAVKKVGRTSGLTSGSIAGINVTINVSYGSAGVATFVNQIYVASNFIRSGDSGSLMVTQSGNNPVGLNFAGGAGASFANPIGPVLQQLGVTVCGG